MFITAVCVIFLIKLRWPKNKSLHRILHGLAKSLSNKMKAVLGSRRSMRTKRRLGTRITAVTPLMFCVTIVTLMTCNLFLLSSLNSIVAVYRDVKQEKHISLKEVKPLSIMILKMKLCIFMFKSFVLFIAAHFFPYF